MADRQETLGVENTTTKTAGPRTFHLMWPQLEGKVHFVYLFKNKTTKKTIEPDWSKFIEVQRKGKSIHQHPQIVKLDLV